MFVNKSAASRILNRQVLKIWTMPNGSIGCVYVQANGKKKSTLISRLRFFEDGIKTRKEAAKGATVIKFSSGCYPGSYDVKSANSNQYRQVMINSAIIKCGCEDFTEQLKHGNGFTKPICKHIYAVFNYLDVSKMSDAILKSVDRSINVAA